MQTFPSEQHVTVYSGTTLENYLTCAVADNGEVSGVAFDKLREPRHLYTVVFYSQDFTVAANSARKIATKLQHTPLVMVGKVQKVRQFSDELMEGELFPVDYILIPKPCFHWRKLYLMTLEELVNGFQKFNPREVLLHQKSSF